MFTCVGAVGWRPCVHYLGEFAALGTALCWTISVLSFESAGRRIGSMSVNLIRLVMAWVLFAIYGLAVRGLPVPTHMPQQAWVWLCLSGLVGFFLGDLCLFRALVVIGPRLSTLVMSLAPPMTALMGWLALGERLTVWNWLGMAVTLAGVAWVVTERKARRPGPRRRRAMAWGLVLAFGGAVGQAGGLVLAGVGLAGGGDPFAAAHIRVTSGAVGFAVLFVFLGWYPRVWRATRQGRAMALSGLGALMGPFLGVSLLLLSIKYIPTGLAQTFVATIPVMILPFVIVLYKERVTARAAAGAALAVFGVVMLFL